MKPVKNSEEIISGVRRGIEEATLSENEWEESIKFSREFASEFYRISRRVKCLAIAKSILIIVATQAAFILFAQLVLAFLP